MRAVPMTIDGKPGGPLSQLALSLEAREQVEKWLDAPDDVVIELTSGRRNQP
jgi:hypothetical protein